MKKAIGVVFQKAGKIYWYDPLQYTFVKDEAVIVAGDHGEELGHVLIPDATVDGEKTEEALLPVLRKATGHDEKVYEQNQKRGEEAYFKAKAIIEEYTDNMKLLECYYPIDNQRLVISYASDDRVDFREMLKELSATFRVRIEMHQVGPREAGRYVGGIGPCGRILCCANSLRDFGLVTMKMAKEQEMNLAGNKTSGLCGKLLCCIGYETDFYDEQHKKVPGTGERIKTPNQENVKVLSADMFKETVRVLNGDKIETWPAADVQRLKPLPEQKPLEKCENHACPKGYTINKPVLNEDIIYDYHEPLFDTPLLDDEHIRNVFKESQSQESAEELDLEQSLDVNKLKAEQKKIFKGNRFKKKKH